MNGVRLIASHSRPDALLLFRLWSEHKTLAEIAAVFGVSKSTVSKWKIHYKLPTRELMACADHEPPSKEDEVASCDSLALSPWVEERARECREKHYEERRRETPEMTFAKVSKWRNDVCQPRGFSV